MQEWVYPVNENKTEPLAQEPGPQVDGHGRGGKTRGARPSGLDEKVMRADESKRRRYERLLDNPHFMDVVEANRAYLTAAVADAASTERDRWTLSCLPGGGVLSRISMGTMETFVVYETGEGTATEIEAFAIVIRSVLEGEFGSLDGFATQYPTLTVKASGYRDAGEDQVSVGGKLHDLVAVLWHDRFAVAAQALAEHLMRRNTLHGRGHNYQLADHVLGRA